MHKFTLLIAIALLGSVGFCQEPTKDEWIASFRNSKPQQDPLAELKRAYQEILDGKVQPGGDTSYNFNHWTFASKRDKQAKLDKAKQELIAQKQRIWANKDLKYPEIDAYSLKKGDVGVIVTSMDELTDRRPTVSSTDPNASAAYRQQLNDLATKVRSYRVLQVLGPKEFLCTCGKTTILISGMDTADMRDGKHIEEIGLVYCVGNATYPTSAGTNTVMKVVPVSSQVADRLTAETKSELSETRVRTWTDITGKHKIEAELASYDGKKVTLKKTDGSSTVLAIGKLSKADREYCEDVLGAPEK